MEMASVCTPKPTHHYKPSSRFRSTTINTNPPPPLIFSPIRHRRPSLNLSTNPNARLSRCLSASPVPPSPPDPNPLRPPGLAGTFSRFQHRVRIFFAVLFWMSLFFWASAWDGRNNNRPRKGPPFRR